MGPTDANSSAKWLQLYLGPTTHVLNTLQRYDPNSKFSKRNTPFPPDFTFSTENCPITEQDIALVEQKQQRLLFCTAVCTLLYLAYNTRVNILFAVWKFPKACIVPGTWLIAYLRCRPYYALEFYPDCTSHPIMRSVYRTVFLVLPSQFSLMPVGKTALILAAPPLAIWSSTMEPSLKQTPQCPHQLLCQFGSQIYGWLLCHYGH